MGKAMKIKGLFFLLALGLSSCQRGIAPGTLEFPKELVQFKAISEKPVFTGTGQETWDKQIRERGFILKEGKQYHLWYTGYSPASPLKLLGYATSKDGLAWQRISSQSIHPGQWVEDVCVLKWKGNYYMFAEGEGDIAHMLISKDRVHWEEQGNLDIRMRDGSPIKPGPYGTPTVFRAKGLWHLFYERDDRGIWLATSTDLKTWTNVQDEPIISMGPDAYDAFAVAMNQVIYYKGLYYGFYHASAFKDWHEWSTNIAVSADLIHWKKYDQNPILGFNQSSGMVLKNGRGFRLYTMHRKVMVYESVPN
jgi:beta-1,2-mannobiose phosphorylase / 1,2-beta-oligomannan phosphorylase